MHIEVFKSVDEDSRVSWYYHIKGSNGRIVADAEAFVSKANAIRAAKNVVRGIFKHCTVLTYPPSFTEQARKDGTTRIRWA